MGPLGTTAVFIRRHNTGSWRLWEPQQPFSGHRQGNPDATPNPDHPQPWMKTPKALLRRTQAPTPRHRPRPPQDRRTQRRRRPACGPPTSQRLRHGATCTTDSPPAVLHEERARGAAAGAHLPQLAATEERVLPGTATSPARVRTHNNPPPMEHQRQRTSWGHSSTKLHRRRTRDRKQTSTSTTMSASPPPWRPAGTWLPPPGRVPYPRCGTRRTTGSPLAWHGILPLRPTRRIFAATMPPCDRWQQPTQPPRGNVMREDSQRS